MKIDYYFAANLCVSLFHFRDSSPKRITGTAALFESADSKLRFFRPLQHLEWGLGKIFLILKLQDIGDKKTATTSHR